MATPNKKISSTYRYDLGDTSSGWPVIFVFNELLDFWNNAQIGDTLILNPVHVSQTETSEKIFYVEKFIDSVDTPTDKYISIGASTFHSYRMNICARVNSINFREKDDVFDFSFSGMITFMRPEDVADEIGIEFYDFTIHYENITTSFYSISCIAPYGMNSINY